MIWQSMLNELEQMSRVKVAEPVTTAEAAKALKRLHELEETKPTAGQLARGALTGAIVGPAGSLASQAVSGALSKNVRGGVQQALSAPTRAGKAAGLGKALISGVRNLGGSAASGAVFGTGLPIVRGHLDREAEKAKLRDFLDVPHRNRTHTAVKKVLGV